MCHGYLLCVSTSTLFSSFLTALLSLCVLFLSGGASVILSLGFSSWCDTVTDASSRPYRYMHIFMELWLVQEWKQLFRHISTDVCTKCPDYKQCGKILPLYKSLSSVIYCSVVKQVKMQFFYFIFAATFVRTCGDLFSFLHACLCLAVQSPSLSHFTWTWTLLLSTQSWAWHR